MSAKITGYCMKERKKNSPMVNVQYKTNSKGRKYAVGKCANCGGGMSAILSSKKGGAGSASPRSNSRKSRRSRKSRGSSRKSGGSRSSRRSRH